MSTYAVHGVLAGSTEGRKVLLSILEEYKTPPPIPSILIIDFEGISLATASFLRECIFSLKNLMRTDNSNWYPILANTCPKIEDELSILTRARHDAVILCNCDKDDIISDRRLFGDLDPIHKRTFDMVVSAGETHAAHLAKTHGDKEGIPNSTAWNNRLKTLVKHGVLMEIIKGRAKVYRPAW